MPIFVNEVHAEVVPPDLGTDADAIIAPADSAELDLFEQLVLARERADRLVAD